MTLDIHAGGWVGTNLFRLMPGDSFYEAPATADLSIGAAGNLTSIAYAWSHAEDGAQTGLLVLGSGDDPGSLIALWADSWHQSPSSKVLAGVVEEGRAVVGYEYGGGWEWQIIIDASASEWLGIRMENVVPESAATNDVPAGGYLAMLATFQRAT